jgi:hypothetical protein
VTLVEAGLFVLVVSTTLAIASVSFWWVPVYLVLLVLIFVTPPRRQPPSSASESSVEFDRAGIADTNLGLETDCVDGTDEIRSVSEFDSDPTIGDRTESTDSNAPVITAGVAKRRGRGRARKATNPAIEPVTDSLPVAWIQVGPGKFVRVEGGGQTAETTQTDEVETRVLPATATHAEATPAAPVQTEPSAEPESFTLPGVSPDDVELSSVSDHCVSESVTEEYGIAPSAFSLTKVFDSSVTASDHELPGQVDEPDVNTASLAEPGGSFLPGSADLGSPVYQPGAARRWVRRIQRGIVYSVSRVDRASWRRIPPTSLNHRFLVGPSGALNASRHDISCRAFRRMLHVQRPVRTRSPPR